VLWIAGDICISNFYFDFQKNLDLWLGFFVEMELGNMLFYFFILKLLTNP
jgi:hypothetical protein